MKNLMLVDGDLVVDGQRSLRMVDGPNEKVQDLQVRLQTRLGEFFLSPRDGLDYAQILGQKPTAEPEMRAAVESCIAQDKRVSSVNKIEFRYKDRHLIIKFEVEMEGTVSGEVQV